MNRRLVLEEEFDAYISWRLKNVDYDEVTAHFKYAQSLVGRK